VLLLLKGRDLGGRVLLVDAALLAVAVDVGELVDGHDVLLVQRRAVQLLDGGDGLGGRAVLDKGVALGLAVVAHGHVHAVLLDLADRVQLAQHKLDQLALAVLGHHGQAVNHHKRIEPLVEPHLELLFNVGKVDARFVELFFLQREVLVGWRHDCRCRVVVLRAWWGVASLYIANIRQNSTVLPPRPR
jgi:hypothetical protein